MLAQRGFRGAGRQVAVVPPPVEADLLRFVERTDEQPDANREQLDFGERHLDVAGNDQPLVEDPIENVHQSGGAVGSWELQCHELRTISRR